MKWNAETKTYWIRGEIIGVNTSLQIQVREYETGIEYWANRYCYQEWDEEINIWFEMEVEE